VWNFCSFGIKGRHLILFVSAVSKSRIEIFFVHLEATKEELSDKGQFHYAMINNWYTGQCSLEVKKKAKLIL
jgi:hypothetical protein